MRGYDLNGAIIPTKEFSRNVFSNVPLPREMGEHEALFSESKNSVDVLGF